MDNKKVMIVDDDKEFLEELGEILASSGYDMIEVNDPLLVMDRALEVRPDLILIDMRMPNKNGFQVALELKGRTEVANIPIVAMSAFFSEKNNVSMMKICGIKRLIRKPFNPLNIIDIIEEVLYA